jgi:ribosome biogenesis GTPase / thiamine phosphate phosphatase
LTIKQKRRRPRSTQRQAWQTRELVSEGEGSGELGVIVGHYGVAVDVRLDSSSTLRSVKVRRRSGHVVGDRVEVIGERLRRLERRSELRRRDAMGNVHVVAANLDTLGIVIAPVPPSPSGFVDRALIAAEAAGLAPILIVNKADLPECAALLQTLRETWLEGPGAIAVPMLCVSATTGAGLDALLDYFNPNSAASRPARSAGGPAGHSDLDLRFAVGRRGAFVGTSGVGKSSLINALLPQLRLPVGEINPYSGLGRHTTTTATLHSLPRGGELIDTPGFRDFGLVDIGIPDLARHFPGFAPLLAAQACRFADCRHRAEPDCAIKQAVVDGRLAAPRWERYLELLAELEQG